MLARADAALIIGDPALTIDAAARGVIKIDLGQRVAGAHRPAVRLAMWSGRDGALRPSMSPN